MAAVPWQALAAQLSPLTLLTEQLHKLAYRTVPLAILSLSSSDSLVSETSWLMGRRDKRTRKGKVFKGSSGNVSQVGMFDNSTIIQAALMAEVLACRHDQRGRSSLPCGGNGSNSKQRLHRSLYQSHTLPRKPFLKHQ